MAHVIYDLNGPSAPRVERDLYSRIRDAVTVGVQRYAEDKQKERWITLGGGDGEGGGAHVKIDKDGNIVAGPKGIADKGITNLSDFGGKKESPATPIGEPGHPDKNPSFGDVWQKHRDSGKNDFNATLHALSDHLKSKGIDVSPAAINAHWSNHHIDSIRGDASDERIKNAFEQSRDPSKDPTDLWWMNQGLNNLPGGNGATQRESDMERRRKNLEGIADQYMEDAEVLTALGSEKGTQLKAKAERILKSVESNRVAFKKAMAVEKAERDKEESAAKEQRRWKPEPNTAKPLTPKQLAKAFDGPRHSFAKMLSETGWYSDGAIAVKPPEKIKQQILSQSTIHDGRYPNIDELASQESSNRNAPMKTIGHRAMEVPGKKGRVAHTHQTLMSDESGNHVSVDSAYLQTIQKMYPNATFHAPQRLHGPIAVKDRDNIVGLLMSQRKEETDAETEAHVREATGAKKVRRYSRGESSQAFEQIMSEYGNPEPQRYSRQDALEQLTAAFSDFTQTFRALMASDPAWQRIGDNQDEPDDEQEILNDDDDDSPGDDDQEQSELQQDIERAASQTDPEPSDAQKEAGNYAKGKFRLWGRTIAIENPRDSVRRGTSHDGEEWQSTMPHHYGYILQTQSEADGDHVDCFIGPNPDSENVFIVNQNNDSGRFDEHKVMIGFDTLDEASEAYEAAYPDEWDGLGSIVPMSKTRFLDWLDNGDSSVPIAAEPDRDKYSRIARYVTVVLSGIK